MERNESRIKTKRRKVIIEAAKELFFKKGLAKTTMIDIANEVDMARTTMYEYYSSKEELLTDIRDEYLLELYTFEWEPDVAMTGYQQLEELINVYFNRLVDHNEIMVFFVEYNRYVITDHIESTDAIDRRSFDIYPKFTAVVERGLEDKSITFNKPKKTLQIVLEALFGIAMRFSIKTEYAYEDGSFTNRDIMNILPIIMKGLKA